MRKIISQFKWSEIDRMARNFFLVHFFGDILNYKSLSYTLVRILRKEYFIRCGIAQLGELSTLMRKYPRSIPGEGE